MLRSWTAYFVVECYDEGKTHEDAGFYPAESLTEVVGYLEQFYGEELVAIKHLELLDTSLVYMKPEAAAKIVSELYG